MLEIFEPSIELTLVMFIACLSFWTHSFTVRYNLIPMKLIVLLYTLVVVTLAHQDSAYADKTGITYLVKPSLLLVLYVPLFMVEAGFTTDKYLVIQTLPSVLLLTTIGYIVQLTVYCTFIKLVVLPDWTLGECYLLVVIFSTNEVKFVQILLNNERYAKFNAIFQGKAVMMLALVPVYFDIGVGLLPDYGAIHTLEECAIVASYKIIVGFIIGFVATIFINCLLKFAHNNTENCVMFMLCAVLICYIFVEMVHAAASVAMLPVWFVILKNKDQLMSEDLASVRNSFSLLYYFTNVGTFLYAVFLIIDVVNYTKHIYVTTAISNYFALLICRGIVYTLAFPAIKFTISSLTWGSVFLLVWANTTSNISLIMAVTLYYKKTTKPFVADIFNYILVQSLLTYSMNSISFVAVVKYQFTKHRTFEQITNMSYVLKYILDQRDRDIGMWKMKGYVADVRWDMVAKFTDVRHFFKKAEKDPINEHLLRLEPRKATCPDCKRVIIAELTTKDIVVMKTEATRRIVKTMKVNLIRLQTSGVISNICVIVAEKIIDESNNIVINLNDLNNYFKSNKVLEAFKSCYSSIFKFNRKLIQLPRKPYRRICYRIVFSKYYRNCMWLLTILSLYPIIVLSVVIQHSLIFYSAVATNFILAFIFLVQFILTIEAYSFVYICHGIRLYFSSYWHLLDFIILIGALIDAALSMIFWISQWYDVFYLRLLRLVVLVKLLQGQMPNMLRFFSDIVDVRIAFGFEVVEALCSCYDEALLVLHKIVVNNYELEIECRERIEKTRWDILNLIQIIQTEKPWVATSVKTKSTVNCTITYMYETLSSLKLTGFLDVREYEKLRRNIKRVEMRQINLSKNWKLQPSEVFHGVFWMTGDSETLAFLRSSATMVYFLPQAEVSNEDRFLKGIYIVVSGVLKIEYSPRVSTIIELLNNGRLPVIDFIRTNNFDRETFELIVPGNSFGELSYLTDRPYDSSITSITDVKAIFIPHNTITKAIKRTQDPMNGVGPRMWKSVVYDLTVSMLSTHDLFEHCSRNEIKQKLERAFVPNLAGYRTVHLNSDIEDVILLDGQITNLLVKEVYNAPCYIPRTVTRFSMTFNDTTFLNSVLLFIPLPDVSISGLLAKLADASDVATDADIDYKSMGTKLGIQNRGVPKSGDRAFRSRTSSFFNTLEMLKISRNQ